ncbi:MAG TPA: MFS transporter [Mycobacterium sp.]|nr:MFS transporter [Mycobacterium sp.]
MTPSQRRRAITAVTIGTVLEYYDWIAYGVFAVYFAPQIFRAEDTTSALLQSAVVFAVGFLVRPLGGILLGRIGDRYGRKRALVISVVLTTAGTLLVAVVPTYDSAGLVGPMMLSVARIVQGIAYGGEYGTVATTLREIAPPDRRGRYSSVIMFAVAVGQILAICVLLVLNAFLNSAQMREFGWRIPFVLAALGALVVVFLRRRMEETPTFVRAAEVTDPGSRGSLVDLVRYNPRSVVLGILMVGGANVSIYTWTVYIQKFLVNTVGLTVGRGSTEVIVVLLVFGGTQPLWGYLADRFGIFRIAALGLVGTVIVPIPLFYALIGTGSSTAAMILSLLAVLPITVYCAVQQDMLTSLFPAERRVLGTGLTQSIGIALFGGTTELIALSFKSAGHEVGHFIYVAAIGGLALLAAALLARRERAGTVQATSQRTHDRSQ